MHSRISVVGPSEARLTIVAFHKYTYYQDEGWCVETTHGDKYKRSNFPPSFSSLLLKPPTDTPFPSSSYKPLRAPQFGSFPQLLVMAYHASIPAPHPPRPYPNGYQNQSFTPIPFIRSEGFLTRMFGRRDAAFFIESLLKADVRDVDRKSVV